MKNINIFLLLLIVSILFSYCSRVSDEELWNTAQNFIQEKKFDEALDNLKILVDKFPKSENASNAQILIASIYNNELEEYQEAIREYRKFVDIFPNDPQAPKALFLIGFIYNNQLYDLDNAKLAYEEFLQKYPDHELAPSAQMEIQTLGKSPEELLQPEVALKDKEESKKK